MYYPTYQTITVEIKLTEEEWKVVARDVAHMQQQCQKVPEAKDWSMAATLRCMLRSRIIQVGEMQKDSDAIEAIRHARRFPQPAPITSPSKSLSD